jgi:hypothetical protein
MSFDLTQITQLIDPVWEEVIQETDEFSAAFWNRIESMPEGDANALGRKVKVRTGYNESESFAPFSSTSGYAQGGNSSFSTFFVPYRTVSTQLDLEQEAIEQDDGKSHYHPVVDEMASTMMAGYKKLNRACLMGDGTGAIGVLTANYSGATPTLVTCAPSATVFGNKGAQFVKPGKLIQIYNSAGTTLRNGTIGGEAIVRVASVNKATGVITLASNGPSDAVTNDIVVPERSAGRGINGLPYWVSSTGSLFGLSRSSVPGLQSVEVDGSSGSIIFAVESMFSQLAHYIEEDVALGINSGGAHEFFWSPTQREAYRKQALGLGIMTLGSDTVDVGYAHNEKINGYNFTVIKDMDNTKIYALRLKDWYRVTRSKGPNPFEPTDIHGNRFYNKTDSQGRISGGISYIFRGYVNVACRNVRTQAVIKNLPVAGLQTGNV